MTSLESYTAGGPLREQKARKASPLGSSTITYTNGSMESHRWDQVTLGAAGATLGIKYHQNHQWEQGEPPLRQGDTPLGAGTIIKGNRVHLR